MTGITKAHLDGLRAEFDKSLIGRLPATAKRPELDFVGHAAVTDRLNGVVPDWTYTVDEMFTMDGTCWIRGTMTIDGVSRTDYGDGKDPKEAVGNMLRRTAMRFGVAIDLWSRQELSPAPPVTVTSSTGGPRDRDHGAPSQGQPSATGETPVVVVAGDTPSGEGSAPDPGGNGPAAAPPSDVLAQLLEAVGGSEARAISAINRATKGRHSLKDLESLTPDEYAAGLAAATMGGTK